MQTTLSNKARWCIAKHFQSILLKKATLLLAMKIDNINIPLFWYFPELDKRPWRFSFSSQKMSKGTVLTLPFFLFKDKKTPLNISKHWKHLWTCCWYIVFPRTSVLSPPDFERQNNVEFLTREHEGDRQPSGWGWQTRGVVGYRF